MRKPWNFAAAFVLTLLLASVYSRQSSAQQDIGQLAESSKAQIAPPAQGDVQARLNALKGAAGRLDSYLHGANGQAWKRYLGWDQLQEQLSAGEKADPAALEDVRRRFVANHQGLELPVFANVAKALDAAIITLEARRAEDYSGTVSSQIDELAKNIAQYEQSPSEERAAAIGTTVGWLERTGQSRPLIQAVRGRFRHPNLYARLSEQLVGAGIGRPINDVGPVHDNILGTDVHGTANTVGTLSVQLVPNRQRAALEATLSGTVYSQTVGYNGPATIHSRGTTTILGREPLLVDSNGLTAGCPTADARTCTTITGVCAGGPGVFGGVVQKIATKQVYKNKSAAEAEASRKAAARVRRRLQDETAAGLLQANREFQNEFRLPLVRRSAYPEVLHFQTNDDYLYATAVQATRSQLGAPDSPPVLQGPSDLAVQVHETLANNLASSFLAGRTLTRDELNKRLIKRYGKLPEEMQDEDEQDPWTITFAEQRPVTLSLDDGGLSVTIRGTGFTSGDREFKAMNISAAYKVEATDSGTRLTRQGDLQIFPPGFVEGRDRFSTQETALRSILRRKFGKLFKEEVVSDGLELPGRLKSAGKLRPVRLEIDRGWFVAQWALPAASPTDAVATTASDR